MNKEKKIAEKFGRTGGMTAPEDFLEGVYANVRERRGDLPRMAQAPPRSLWHKFRPYIYMAAMFAGIWCMMKVFTANNPGVLPTSLQTARTENVVSLDNPPQLLAQAAVTPEVAKELSLSREVSAPTETEYELEQAVADQYADFAQFEEAFDYEFDDEYADINIDSMLAQVPAADAQNNKE